MGLNWLINTLELLLILFRLINCFIFTGRALARPVALARPWPVGHNRAKNTATHFTRFVWCPWFLNVFFGFLGSLIVPRWLIHDSWHIPIRFGTFLELPKTDNKGTIGPFIYHQNISGYIRKYGKRSQQYYVCKYGQYMFLIVFEHRCTNIFEIYKIQLNR